MHNKHSMARKNGSPTRRLSQKHKIRTAPPSQVVSPIEQGGSHAIAPEPVQNRALSVRQPLAEQILRGTKKVEYRTKPTYIRGRVYLYASQTPAAYAYEEMGTKPGDFPTGMIVGTVEIVGCSGYSDAYEWHLARPERLAELIKPERHPQPSWFRPFLEESSSD